LGLKKLSPLQWWGGCLLSFLLFFLSCLYHHLKYRVTLKTYLMFSYLYLNQDTFLLLLCNGCIITTINYNGVYNYQTKVRLFVCMFVWEYHTLKNHTPLCLWFKTQLGLFTKLLCANTHNFYTLTGV
jgi:hypothetical protein